MKPTFLDKTIMRPFVVMTPRWLLPNYITAVRIFLVPVVFIFLLFGNYKIGGVIFVFAAFTDAWDGAVARLRGQITDFGKIFDPLADKFLILFSAGFMFPRFFETWLFLLMLITEIVIVSYALNSKKIAKREIGANIFGKIKMVLQSIGLILIFGFATFFPLPVLLSASYYVICLAIIFALISLWYDDRNI